MANLKENYLLNEKHASRTSFPRRHHLTNDFDELGRLSKVSRINSYDNRPSAKKIIRDRESSAALRILDRPLKKTDCLLSKSAHNLVTHNFSTLNDPLNDSFTTNPSLSHSLSRNLSINTLLARLYQMEQQVEVTSAKLCKFEKKIEELNRENDELTQALLANRAKGFNETTKKNSTYNAMKEEIATLKERLDTQVLLNSKFEKENTKLLDKLQQNQTKLVESEEKHDHLMQIKNRELDEHKLKIEQLNAEIQRREDENNQLELDKQHLFNKVSMLNQVTDKQDEKLERHNDQLKRFEQEIERCKKQIETKDTENEKLRKELILSKNSLKKIQNLNQTNENLIIWLNKQLTDSQSKYNLLYPKTFKKSTSINLNQSKPMDYESNLSEALSDSHLLNNRLRNEYRSELRSRNQFKPDFRDEILNDCDNDSIYRPEYRTECLKECRTQCKASSKYLAELKNELKNDFNIKRQFNNIEYNANNLDRRLNGCPDHCSVTAGRPKESKSNFNPHNLLYTNTRLPDDVESFKCSIGK